MLPSIVVLAVSITCVDPGDHASSGEVPPANDEPVPTDVAKASVPVIVAGKGWGQVVLGAKRKTVESVVGDGQIKSRYEDVYFVNYRARGIEVSYNNTDSTVNTIYFYNKQKDGGGYEDFATFDGKVEFGVDWKSSPREVIKAYGMPREEYEGGGSLRLVFDGIDFRWEKGNMVRIGVPGT